VSKPPVITTLTWQGEMRFLAATPAHSVLLDGDSKAGPSPVEALAMALAGCMAIDVADIVVKGRHDLTSLEARLVGRRRDEPPRHLVSVTLHFAVTGAVPAQAVERAIQLSRDKYCSVWLSLRQDIDLFTSFEVAPAA
jgi:putative redox protein